MELPSCSQKRTSTRSSCSRSALAGTNISRPYSAISRPYSAEQPAPPRDSRHARKYSTRRSNTRWCLSPIVVDPSPDVDTGHPQSMVHVQRRSNAAGPSPRAACPLERATPPRHVSCFSRVAAPNGRDPRRCHVRNSYSKMAQILRQPRQHAAGLSRGES